MSNFIIKTIGNTLNFASYFSPKYASSKALSLFATPRKGRYNESQEQIVASAKFKLLKYQDTDIATYHWQGKGKTILLVHGWESNVARWDFLLEVLLKQDFNIVALDGPAHGKSGSKEFNAVLYSEFVNVVAKHFKPEVAIGHSVGGMASIFFMHNYQQNSIKKLISLGAPAHFTGVFARYKSMMGYNNRIAKGLDALVLKRFNKSVDYFSAAEFTKTITVEGLIIHDKHDKIIPFEDAQLFASNYKNSKLISTEGFGHSLRHKSLISEILEFINA